VGLKHRDAMPMLELTPVTWKVSFTEMGTPWRGPRGWLVRARWESRKWAQARAEVKRGSVSEVVSWWMIADL